MTNDKASPRKALFLHGAPSYLDALTALRAFEGEVEAMCNRAYSRHKDKLLPAMGLSDDDAFELYTDNEPAERWAAAGIYRGIQKAGVKGPCFCIYLYFSESQEDTREITAKVWLDFARRGARDEAYDQIRRKNPHCAILPDDETQYWALVLERPFELNDAVAGPNEILGTLISDWIGLCESIGGLKVGGR